MAARATRETVLEKDKETKKAQSITIRDLLGKEREARKGRSAGLLSRALRGVAEERARMRDGVGEREGKGGGYLHDLVRCMAPTWTAARRQQGV
jgi:hypothetical protein